MTQGNDKNNLKISIIIPVRNNATQLKECLQSIIASTNSDYECIVVDDGSTDNTLTVAQQFPVRIIEISEPQGPAYARNRGAEAASKEILFFIDSDVKIYPDSLSIIKETFSNNPEIDAIIGSYDDEPQESSFISQYKNLFHHYVHQNSNEKACTFWSGCGAIRRNIFHEFGGFDEKYHRPAIEDIELGYRLIENNRNIMLLRQLQVKHLKQWTFWGLIKTEIFDRGIPWTKLMFRQKIFPNDLNLKISHRISAMLILGLLISVLFLVVKLQVSSSVFLLTLLLGLIGYMSFISDPQKNAAIIWSLIIYILSTGFFLISIANRIPSSLHLEIFTILILASILLLLQFKWLYKFFIRNKRYVLAICIGYPFTFAFLVAVYYQRLSFLPVLFLFILILVNYNFYKFFIQKRGLVFTLMVIPLHILYYLYCEISFILGMLSYFLGRKS